MNFYDIVSETCTFDADFAKRLGFKQIFKLRKEIRPVGHGYEQEKIVDNSMAFGRDKNQLISLVKNGATAVAITDSYIDKKLMDTIKQESCILCIPTCIITASYGVERSRNIYKMSRLFAYAKKQGIDVCFASIATSKAHVNSYMQLIELAKLIGADEKYARYSISEITKSIAIT